MIPSPSIGRAALQNGYDKVQASFFDYVAKDHRDLAFIIGKKFAFRPPMTIIIGPPEESSELLLLHEVAHALCGHKNFRVDIERLKMENEAWEKARELALCYKIPVDEARIQDELDTYRDWLHKKSRCPECGLTRFQTPDSQYHCPRCENLT